MLKINSLSGGKTSSYLAVHYPADIEMFALVCIDDKRCAPKDPCVIRYVNDKLSKGGYTDMYGDFIATSEDDKTLIVMMELEQLIGREIIWVRGKSFDEVIDEGTKTWLPSWARRYCTTQMKLLPIFEYWFLNIGKKVDMRIGFRNDEFKRMQDFYNGGPTNFSIPISCSLSGQNRQKWETFKWRYVSMPLVRDGITVFDIHNFWAKKHVGDLFTGLHLIDFPVTSNCVGCFHKGIDDIALQGMVNPEKMQWFIDQEKKGKGTWLDSKLTYEEIIMAGVDSWEWAKQNNAMCDSGGCHD